VGEKGREVGRIVHLRSKTSWLDIREMDGVSSSAFFCYGTRFRTGTKHRTVFAKGTWSGIFPGGCAGVEVCNFCCIPTVCPADPRFTCAATTSIFHKDTFPTLACCSRKARSQGHVSSHVFRHSFCPRHRYCVREPTFAPDQGGRLVTRIFRRLGILPSLAQSRGCEGVSPLDRMKLESSKRFPAEREEIVRAHQALCRKARGHVETRGN